jgi:hypothetical protein
MKERSRLFQRKNGIFFLEDLLLNKQNSLKSRDAEAARRICHAKNEALRQPAINLQIARAYLRRVARTMSIGHGKVSW